MPATVTGCLDCNTEEMPLDTVLTFAQWETICPEGGMLCASCIVKRASKLPRVIDACLRIQFADDYDGDEPGGRAFQAMKQLDHKQGAAAASTATAP